MRLHDENASFRINQAGLRKFLGDLECEIMELVWQKAKPLVTVREIYELLKLERPIAYTTVMTTMVRLAEKGILEVKDKSGLANCYSPAEARDQFIAHAVKHVLEIFTVDFPDASEQFFSNWETGISKQKASMKRR
jgi:predicted transcriptional regulator